MSWVDVLIILEYQENGFFFLYSRLYVCTHFALRVDTLS